MDGFDPDAYLSGKGQTSQDELNAQGLSPDVEALRQRNMAEAMRQSAPALGGALQGFDVQPEVQAITGTGGLPLPLAATLGGAGAVNLIRRAAGAVPGLIGAGNEASSNVLGQIPLVGPALQAVGRLPMQALGAVGDVVGGAIENQAAQYGLTPEVRQALIQSILKANPEQAKYLNETGTGLATDVGTAGALAGLGVAAKEIPFNPAQVEQRSLGKAAKEVQQYAPPLRRELNYKQNYNKWSQYIAPELRKTPIDETSGESAARQITDLTAQAQDQIWNKKLAGINNKYRGAKIIDGNNAVNQVNDFLNSDFAANTLKPEWVDAVRNQANRLSGQFTPDETSKLITSMNADLKGFYKKSGADQATIENKYGGVAGLKVIRDALADTYFDTMDRMGEPSVKPLRQDYGALANMHDALERNVVRAEKPPPPTVWRGIRSAGGVGAGVLGDVLASHFGADPYTAAAMGLGAWKIADLLQKRALPDATIARAAARIAKSSLNPPEYPSPDINIRGQLTRGATPMGAGPDVSGLRPTVGTEYMPQTGQRLLTEGIPRLPNQPEASGIHPAQPIFTETGQRLLPPATTRIAPGYMSTGAQQADVLRVQPPYQTGESLRVQRGTQDIAAHRKLVEKGGATYLGTDNMGKIWYDDIYGGTNAIPKGTTPAQAAQMIAKSNATQKP